MLSSCGNRRCVDSREHRSEELAEICAVAVLGVEKDRGVRPRRTTAAAERCANAAGRERSRNARADRMTQLRQERDRVEPVKEREGNTPASRELLRDLDCFNSGRIEGTG